MIPTINAKFQTDPFSEFNLHLSTSNFIFIPEYAGLKNKNGRGHAHLYIDGQKFARLYGYWYHINKIPEDSK